MFIRAIYLLLLSSLSVIAKTKIMGQAQCTAEQMKAYLKQVNPNVSKKYLKTPSIYLKEGKIEGVRGDLAFAQALLETNFFRFTGSVQSSQNNFAGIGAVDNATKGNKFSTMRQGIRAQIQHLKAYASDKKLNRKCVDPRFSLVKKRNAFQYIEDLDKWACPGYDPKKYTSFKMAHQNNDTYGHKIVKHLKKIQQCK